MDFFNALIIGLLFGFFKGLVGLYLHLPIAALSTLGRWTNKKLFQQVLACTIAYFVGLAAVVLIGLLGFQIQQINKMKSDIFFFLLIIVGTIIILFGIAEIIGKRSPAVFSQKQQKIIFWVLPVCFLFGPYDPIIVRLQEGLSIFGISIIIAHNLVTIAMIYLAALLCLFIVIPFLKKVIPRKYGSTLIGMVIVATGIAGMFITDQAIQFF